MEFGMLELTDIKKSYLMQGSDVGQVVLDGIDLKVKAGDSLAIVGPSGCGKSTLLNIIGTLDKPDSGKVIFEGNDITGVDDTELARIRNSRIGFVFQLHHLLPQLTVLENVLLPVVASENKAGKADRARELLERVGLKDCQSKLPGQLSGGQRQRVAVVRAMINEPALLLADEPTGSLDKESSENIANLLLEVNESFNVGLVIVTHSDGLASKMKKILQLDNGVLNEMGAGV
jgi:lipoprotein-releasing system ATP-binding protein